ncbi:hypothetical protein TRAPUB_8948 [Trametes pubescens]|uniref:Extracellular membrane protein CFEM domain-containing protein n=1 Tax=Trametes pubescens TaxID=154538 RepID=A0A1M2W414_TRAPU|nr:hypothetical protein TRAPUB_8948 [Trametes pubescens]
MFIENFAALSFAVAAAFVWARALDTASGTSTLPIPTTVITCIQQCFDQAELQSGCNGVCINDFDYARCVRHQRLFILRV